MTRIRRAVLAGTGDAATGPHVEDVAMKLRPILFALVAALATTAAAAPSGETLPHRNPHQSTQQTRDMADATLRHLFAIEPSARTAINQGYGYAVFEIDANGNGQGILFLDSIREETLMGVHGSGPLQGTGYRQVWILRDPRAYREFVSHGWTFPQGARLQPRMVRGQQWPAGALDVNGRILVYHLTDDGLASEAALPPSSYMRNWAWDRRRVSE